MYDIQNESSVPLLWEVLYLRDWQSIFSICKGRTRNKWKHYPWAKSVACGFGRALNLKESFISIQWCWECMSIEYMRSGTIILPHKTCFGSVLGQQTHNRCSSVLQIPQRQTVVPHLNRTVHSNTAERA